MCCLSLWYAHLLSFLLVQKVIFLKPMKIKFKGPSLVWVPSKTLCLILYCNLDSFS